VKEEELRIHCLERLAGFKTPKRFVLIDALPKNASGKILKRNLRDQFVASTPKAEAWVCKPRPFEWAYRPSVKTLCYTSIYSYPK
jgi:hypothetical protein